MFKIRQNAGLLNVVLAAILCLCALLEASSARAEHPTLLTVQPPEGEVLHLSLAELDALPQHQFSTETQWTEGVLTFSGPALADVLALGGIDPHSGNPTRLVAANQYEINLDGTLIEDDLPILATRIDGKTFGAREKGPLWVVFPYDADRKYQSERVYSTSIWQLVQISAERRK